MVNYYIKLLLTPCNADCSLDNIVLDFWKKNKNYSSKQVDSFSSKEEHQNSSKVGNQCAVQCVEFEPEVVSY